MVPVQVAEDFWEKRIPFRSLGILQESGGILQNNGAKTRKYNTKSAKCTLVKSDRTTRWSGGRIILRTQIYFNSLKQSETV